MFPFYNSADLKTLNGTSGITLAISPNFNNEIELIIYLT